ncbi:MerR family transcriptional regulator [Microbulbifer sp. SAOS-129_SWC]|uniref:MerR family transcriptional regulator n=1 Tax=Microbulbifer sp. SAOS-129_SWC TaxID=3145235 RepID=UPI00321635C0
MKIGELAQRTGLAASRIRFYERIGLLQTVEREANGYRSYPDEAVVMLNLITTAQQAGFSLDELRALLPASLEQWQHGSLVNAIKRKIDDIEALQQQLAQSKAHLAEVLTQVEAKPEDIDCATNAKRVLSQMGLGSGKRPALADNKTESARKKARRH